MFRANTNGIIKMMLHELCLYCINGIYNCLPKPVSLKIKFPAELYRATPLGVDSAARKISALTVILLY